MAAEARLIRSVVRFGAEVWTLPNSLIGLFAGLLSGGRPRRVPGRSFLGVRSGKGISSFVRRRGPSATTFGSIVVFWNPAAADREDFLDHEEVHVRQYRVLGPFFLPIYLLFLPFTGWRERHPLERPAYRRQRRPAEGGRRERG